MAFREFFLRRVACLLVMVSIAACATESLFPPEAVKDLDPTSQMGIFNPEADVYFKGHLGEVGGQIIASEPVRDGVLITAEELPIKDRCVIETAKPGGRFLFLYSGPIDGTGRQRGNKFILIGMVEGTQRMLIEGVQHPVPYLVARCIHVWKTGRYAITDFPYLPDGYASLERQTYCLTPAK